MWQGRLVASVTVTSRKLPSDMCWVTGYCLHLLNIIVWKNPELLFIFMTIKAAGLNV